MKAILFLSNSLGSSGFSEACPQPAHTAYTNNVIKKIKLSLTIHYSKCVNDNFIRLPELENE